MIHFEDTGNEEIKLANGSKEEHTYPAIEKKPGIWAAAKIISLGSVVVGILVAGIPGAIGGVALNLIVRVLEKKGSAPIIKTDRSERAPGEEPRVAKVTLWQRLYRLIRWMFWD